MCETQPQSKGSEDVTELKEDIENIFDDVGGLYHVKIFQPNFHNNPNLVSLGTRRHPDRGHYGDFLLPDDPPTFVFNTCYVVELYGCLLVRFLYSSTFRSIYDPTSKVWLDIDRYGGEQGW